MQGGAAAAVLGGVGDPQHLCNSKAVLSNTYTQSEYLSYWHHDEPASPGREQSLNIHKKVVECIQHKEHDFNQDIMQEVTKMDTAVMYKNRTQV